MAQELMKINASTMMAEVAGVIMGHGTALFKVADINRFKSAPPYVCPLKTHGVLFVVVDPSGGGVKSDYAVMTMCATARLPSPILFLRANPRVSPGTTIGAMPSSWVSILWPETTMPPDNACCARTTTACALRTASATPS